MEFDLLDDIGETFEEKQEDNFNNRLNVKEFIYYKQDDNIYKFVMKIDINDIRRSLGEVI